MPRISQKYWIYFIIIWLEIIAHRPLLASKIYVRLWSQILIIAFSFLILILFLLHYWGLLLFLVTGFVIFMVESLLHSWHLIRLKNIAWSTLIGLVVRRVTQPKRTVAVIEVQLIMKLRIYCPTCYLILFRGWNIGTTHLLLNSIWHVLVFVDFTSLNFIWWIWIKVFKVVLNFGSFFSLSRGRMPRHLILHISCSLWFLDLIIILNVFNFISSRLGHVIHFWSDNFHFRLFPRGWHSGMGQIIKDRGPLVDNLIVGLIF